MEKTEIKMSTKLKEELMENETVEWMGKAEAFPLVNAGTKKGIMLRWIISAVLAVALSVIYIVASTRTAGFKPVVELLILVVLAYVACAPMLDRSKVLKKCTYLVTDKRVLLAVGDKDAFALSRAGLKVKKAPAQPGCMTLLFGACTEVPEKKYLLSAFMAAKAEGTEDVTGFAFYNVKEDPVLCGFFGI